MTQNSYNLIQVTTSDQLRLNGLYQPGSKDKEACLFIHGFTTDFYSHDFYHAISGKLNESSYAITLAQTRGTGVETEFIKTDGSGQFIGSYFEKIEEAHLDISAFIKFLLSEGYSKISLIGHSLGTIKSVRYLFEGEYADRISKMVLLAPFDKNAFMERKAPGRWLEFVNKAEEHIKNGRGNERIPVPEYEDFPMSWNTFFSWYRQDDLGCMWDFYRTDYDFPILQKIKVPVKVIIGDMDEFMSYATLGVTPKSALEKIEKFLVGVETVLLPNCDHVYRGREAEAAEEVCKFI